MLSYQKLKKKKKFILNIVGFFRYNHVKFLKLFIHTIFLGSK